MYAIQLTTQKAGSQKRTLQACWLGALVASNRNHVGLMEAKKGFRERARVLTELRDALGIQFVGTTLQFFQPSPRIRGHDAF